MSDQQPPEPMEVTLARIAGVSEQINARLENVATRLGNLEQKVDTRIDGLEQKVESRIDSATRIGGLENSFSRLENCISRLENRINAQFITLVVLIIGSIIVPFAERFIFGP